MSGGLGLNLASLELLVSWVEEWRVLGGLALRRVSLGIGRAFFETQQVRL